MKPDDINIDFSVDLETLYNGKTITKAFERQEICEQCEG